MVNFFYQLEHFQIIEKWGSKWVSNLCLTLVEIYPTSNIDSMVVEIMKLSALADVQKRFETGEPW